VQSDSERGFRIRGSVRLQRRGNCTARRRQKTFCVSGTAEILADLPAAAFTYKLAQVTAALRT
jgi:predicted pyridoxine 5'-phosphate oxidase superfamily flavin-nucleotide-binding protein